MDLLLPTASSPYIILLNVILLFGIFISIRKVLRAPYMINKRKFRTALILAFLFCIFSFWGPDWFHYLEFFPYLKSGISNAGMEDVYKWIAQYLSPNYIFFRCIIWGTALYLFLKTISILSISKHLALLFWGCFFILWFSYARVSLAMSLVYLGFALLIKIKKNLYSYILGVLFIVCSFYFHKTAGFGIVMVLSAFILSKNIKWGLGLIILSFPIILIYIRLYVISYAFGGIDSVDEQISQYMVRGQNYLNSDEINSGWGNIIARFLELSPYYLIAIIGCITIISKRYTYVPSDIKAFILLQILIVLISSTFLFISNVNTDVFYVRFMRYALIPTTVLITYFYQNRICFRLIKMTIFILMCSTIYSMTYSMYLSSLSYT